MYVLPSSTNDVAMANSKGVKTIFVRFQSFFKKKVEWSFFPHLIFLFSISGKHYFFFSTEKKNRECVSKVRCNNVLDVTVE